MHDEIWNFYEGSPLRLLKYDGKGVIDEIIGKNCDSYNSIVPGGIFQAAETTGEYTLVGCSVAPGFDFEDFSFLDSKANKLASIKNNYPELHRLL